MGDLVLEALRRAVAALQASKIPFALVGGLALQAWGRVRQTKDVDLAVLLDPSRFEEALRSGEKAGLLRDPKGSAVSVEGGKVLRLLHRDADTGIEVRVDWLQAPSAFHREVVERAVPRKVFDLELPIATCEDLILMKLAVGRPLDRGDAEELLAGNLRRLDLPYLRSRASRLRVKGELEASLREAGSSP